MEELSSQPLPKIEQEKKMAPAKLPPLPLLSPQKMPAKKDSENSFRVPNSEPITFAPFQLPEGFLHSPCEDSLATTPQYSVRRMGISPNNNNMNFFYGNASPQFMGAMSNPYRGMLAGLPYNSPMEFAAHPAEIYDFGIMCAAVSGQNAISQRIPNLSPVNYCQKPQEAKLKIHENAKRKPNISPKHLVFRISGKKE